MAIHYLALGDSYTIGTGSSTESRNFPGHLARKLEEVTGQPVQLRNPAVDAYTTEDLIRTELVEVDRFRPDLVTILIGANDIVQGVDEPTYRSRLEQIYGKVKALALPPGRVLTLSIPDFSIVPAAPSSAYRCRFERGSTASTRRRERRR